MEDNLSNFLSKVRKLKEIKVHKVKNSLGVYDAFKWIRKNKWLTIERPLTSHEFYSIIRSVNLMLVENFLQGYTIKFPYKMGQLELRKIKSKITIDKGKIRTKLPIDWDKTLKLWYEDEVSYNNKILIKIPEKEIYRIYYSKHYSNYINHNFYEFNINRKLKRSIKNYIKEDNLDAYEKY